jgi:hypothetical protein
LDNSQFFLVLCLLNFQLNFSLLIKYPLHQLVLILYFALPLSDYNEVFVILLLQLSVNLPLLQANGLELILLRLFFYLTLLPYLLDDGFSMSDGSQIVLHGLFAYIDMLCDVDQTLSFAVLESLQTFDLLLYLRDTDLGNYLLVLLASLFYLSVLIGFYHVHLKIAFQNIGILFHQVEESVA